MTLAAERLVDWKLARAAGRRVAGTYPDDHLTSLARARLLEDFADLVPRAEALVQGYTGLSPNGFRSRPWVMTRSEWIDANLRGFERLLEPFARKVVAEREGPLARVRRGALGAQVGGLLGYLARRVLGQYDLFLPPDDEGLLYFVGANVISVERKNSFPSAEFRLWLALHETAHRLQFGGAPWLKDYLSGLMSSYLDTIEIDPGWLIDSLRRAVEEVRSGRGDHRGFGWIFLLMTPDQREMVRKMQAVMSLLEGHGNFVMEAVSQGHIPNAGVFRRRLHERRNRGGVEKAFQKAIGFDVKVRQYDMGVGVDGFNRVWDRPANLPTMEEVGRPNDWVARVAS